MPADIRRKQLLGELGERMMASPIDVARMDSVSPRPLPCQDSVVEIAVDLKQLLYAGFLCRHQAANAKFQVGNLLSRLHDRLTEQIAMSLHHSDRLLHDSAGELDFEAMGQERTLAFLERLPQLRLMVARDAQAALDGDPAATGIEEVLLCYPGLEAITIQRLAHELHQLKVPLIPRMLTEWAHARTGIDIHPGAQIGSSFFIDHGTGVVIGATCEIADNVKIYQGVTLGALSFPRDDDGNIIRGKKRHPTIQDNVVIYANATVLGGTTVVGSGSVIGASVSLTRSIPPNTVVTVDNNPSLRFRQAS